MIGKRLLFAALILLIGSVLYIPGVEAQDRGRVSLPTLKDATITPRIRYLENSRFPSVSDADLAVIIDTAARLTKEHFDITLEIPKRIRRQPIEPVFRQVLSRAPEGYAEYVGSTYSGNTDWSLIEQGLERRIRESGNIADQIEFARPYLTSSLQSPDIKGLTKAAIETMRSRFQHWATMKLQDGSPALGAGSRQENLPLNEYAFWSLMARQGQHAEITITNQMVASVERISVSIHHVIRGGMNVAATEYDPTSKYGSSVWLSLAPLILDDPQLQELRSGKDYSREEALAYAGALLAHEIGHMALLLGHPWSNRACIMRPAELLDFATWVKSHRANDCPIGSHPQMKPGVVRIGIW